MADWSVEEAECIEAAYVTATYLSMHGKYECELYSEYKDMPAASRKYVINELSKKGFLVTSTEFDDTLKFNWRCNNRNTSQLVHDCNEYTKRSNEIEDKIEDILYDIKRMAARGEKYTAVDVSPLGNVFQQPATVVLINHSILAHRIYELGYDVHTLAGQFYVIFPERMERG